MSTYSSTPLIQKLGIKEGASLAFLQVPSNYSQLLGHSFNHSVILTSEQSYDFIHFFTTSEKELSAEFSILKESLESTGILWISWPKKSSLAITDLTENKVRDIGLKNGLVDVKICAVDEIWSALKFVYRLADR